MQEHSNTRHFFAESGEFQPASAIFLQLQADAAKVSANGRAAALPWPEKKHARQTVVPVFLPFSGCATRCVFCSQESQTGQSGPASLAELEIILQNAAIEAGKAASPPELAFYGGTFTAQDDAALGRCLDFARDLRARGKIVSFRCSTRPDCVDGPVLSRLAQAGCSLVELGVQTFDDEALAKSRRGYDGRIAEKAIRLVREYGLGPGVQLLPGLPGQKPSAFANDVARAIGLGATCLRFYPCQVPENTALAVMWKKGEYSPWPLALAIRLLARGLLLANAARVPVIRMGLAPQEGFLPLAGPAHPALGGIVMARSLLLGALFLARRLGAKNFADLRLHAPKCARGYIGGHKNSLLPVWKHLGLEIGEIKFDCEKMVIVERS